MNLYVLEKFERVGNVRAMFPDDDFSELSDLGQSVRISYKSETSSRPSSDGSMVTDELTWKPVAPVASPQSSFITSTKIGKAILKDITLRANAFNVDSTSQLYDDSSPHVEKIVRHSNKLPNSEKVVPMKAENVQYNTSNTLSSGEDTGNRFVTYSVEEAEVSSTMSVDPSVSKFAKLTEEASARTGEDGSSVSGSERRSDLVLNDLPTASSLGSSLPSDSSMQFNQNPGTQESVDIPTSSQEMEIIPDISTRSAKNVTYNITNVGARTFNVDQPSYNFEGRSAASNSSSGTSQADDALANEYLGDVSRSAKSLTSFSDVHVLNLKKEEISPNGTAVISNNTISSVAPNSVLSQSPSQGDTIIAGVEDAHRLDDSRPHRRSQRLRHRVTLNPQQATKTSNSARSSSGSKIEGSKRTITRKAKSRYSVYDASLPSPTTSPCHFNEITDNAQTPKPTRTKTGLRGQKIHVYQSPKLILPRLSPSTEGLRRSKRTKLPLLRHYAGERPIYELDKETRTRYITGVQRSSPSKDFELEWISKKQIEKKKKNKRSKSRKAKDSSLHLEDVGSDVSLSDNEISVYDAKQQTYVKKVVNCKSKDSTEYDCRGNVADSSTNVRLVQHCEFDTVRCGEIILDAFSEKSNSVVRGYTATFCVLEGAVLLTINSNNKKLITNHDSFIVPEGNSYQLKNLKKSTAKIFYTVTSMS